MKKDNIQDLINQAKDNNQTNVLQNITPIKNVIKNEIQFSFYIDKMLLKELKQKSLNEETTVKQIVVNAIKKYLEK